MDYKTGFKKKDFEADHFVFKRGSGEKYFNGWSDVRYHYGLTPQSCDEHQLEQGNMGRALYECLCHTYGEEGMAKYFPTPAPQQKPKPMLHFSFDAVAAYAAHQGKQNEKLPSGVMTDEEVDNLAAIM